MRRKGHGPGASIFERLRRTLRGVDHARRPALPVGEALHPAALAAIALLLVNDWILKPRVIPDTGASFVTGKLSDIAGLAFAPVALSAAIGLVLHAAARLGARVDPSLSRRRLVLCVLATGAGFAAVKLDPALAARAAGWLGHLGRPARFYDDPTDLLTLPALLAALWIGRDELRRVPLGRPAAILRLGRPAGPALTDVRRAGAPPARIDALAAALDARDPDRVDALISSSA
ncbi:MAG TPA: hypothetical protein VNO30_39505 [Kofleriaceae bacterium]|nr:hypothetical protein [Kofleriaceae bacterium]